MTLDETFSFGLIHFSNFYVLIGLASFHETIGIDHDTARTLIFINSLGKAFKKEDIICFQKYENENIELSNN